jgi:hypothetical protein
MVDNTIIEKKIDDYCILNLLKIHRSIKRSCFSDDQIDLIYLVWLKFKEEVLKEEKQKNEEIISLEEKHNILYTKKILNDTEHLLVTNEFQWVMGFERPTKFISFLTENEKVLEYLRMSFKPEILHNEMIESPDFIVLLMRYEFWLEKKDNSLNFLGINDSNNYTTFPSMLEMMANKLLQGWNQHRFHLAIINERMHWQCVLIDRNHKTFEYYNPFGVSVIQLQNESQTKQIVTQLYSIIKKLEPNIKTYDVEELWKTRKSHQTDGLECGIYVISFFHSRIINNMTFEQFVNLPITTKDCQNVRPLFFYVKDNGHNVILHKRSKSKTLSQRKSKSKSKEKEFKVTEKHRFANGNYDIRLSALDFIRFMTFAEQFLTNNDAIMKVDQQKQQLVALILSDRDYMFINAKITDIQDIILKNVHESYKSYIQDDLWTRLISEVINDPLTLYLRSSDVNSYFKTNEKNSRSKNTARKDFSLQIFKELTNWTKSLNQLNNQNQNPMETYMKQIIDNQYIPILHFNPQNKDIFIKGMLPEDFLYFCMNKIETVSFGVHFLREINRANENIFKVQVNSQLNYQFKSPESDSLNMIIKLEPQKAMQFADQCNQILQRAKYILKEVYFQMQTSFYKNPLISKMERMEPINTNNNNTLSYQQKYVDLAPFEKMKNINQEFGFTKDVYSNNNNNNYLLQPFNNNQRFIVNTNQTFFPLQQNNNNNNHFQTFDSKEISDPRLHPLAIENFAANNYKTEDIKVIQSSNPLTKFLAVSNDPVQNQQDKLNFIIIQLQNDLYKKTFMQDGIKPWNFPMNFVKFRYASSIQDKLAKDYTFYSLTDEEMEMLLITSEFKIYYGMGVIVLTKNISDGTISDVLSVSIALGSLFQMFNISKNGSEDQVFICTLLNHMYISIQKRSNVDPVFKKRLDNFIKEYLEQLVAFHEVCLSNQSINTNLSLFHQIEKIYGEIMSS